MTLIEILAALAILSSLIAAVVVARGQYVRQWSTAQDRLAAVQAVDDLLAGWWQTPATIPRSGSGTLAGHPELTWSATTRPLPGIGDGSADRVTFSFSKENDPARILVTIDLVLPHE